MKQSKETDAKASEKFLTRGEAAEALCIYGKCLCEHIILTSGHNGRGSPVAAAALDLVIYRLQRLLAVPTTSQKEPKLHRPMKNFFNGDDSKVASATGLCVAEVERMRPLFSCFWLAHLFVLYPDAPLLEALVCLAFQVSQTLRSLHASVFVAPMSAVRDRLIRADVSQIFRAYFICHSV